MTVSSSSLLTDGVCMLSERQTMLLSEQGKQHNRSFQQVPHNIMFTCKSQNLLASVVIMAGADEEIR